jgi:hypothetical protein
MNTVTIELNDLKGEKTEYVLKPSVKATKLLSRRQGGLMNVAQQIMSLDIDTMVQVINLGVGFTEKGAEKLDERVYERGLSELAAPLVKYIHILSNGGKAPKEDEGDVNESGND